MALRNEMAKYNHMAGLKIVGEVLPQEKNRVELADETDEYGLRIPRVIFSYGEEDKRLYEHAIRFMSEALKAAGGWTSGPEEDTAHIAGTCRMGTHPRDSVTNEDGRTWDIPNLWVCDGSLMPTSRGQSVANDPGKCLPHRRPHPRIGPPRRTIMPDRRAGMARSSFSCRFVQPIRRAPPSLAGPATAMATVPAHLRVVMPRKH